MTRYVTRRFLVGVMSLSVAAVLVHCGNSENAEGGSADAGMEGSAGAGAGGSQTDSSPDDASNETDPPVEGGTEASDGESPHDGDPPDVADAPYVPPTPGTVIADDPAGRTWPAAHGEAMISLWEDDALGVLTITVDDNTAPEHAWWVAQSETYGLKVTWFVITDRVGTGGYWGTWAGFADLIAKGHDVQSHTVTHLSGSLSIDDEYRLSQEAIESNLPGTRALTLAYPGGTNSSMNDVDVAKTYYLGARSTVGHDNPVTQIEYMGVNSISGKFNLVTDHWAGLPNVVVYNSARPKSYRAWHCIHYHQVGDQDNAVEGFEFIKAHEGDLWVGLFREVVLYGKEREAATLVVPNVTQDFVELGLTDTLDDSLFDYPLTLKVGLASSWTGATATQGGQAVPVRIVTNEGNNFALVRAVPDRGVVRLSRVP